MTYQPTPAVAAVVANCKRLIHDAEVLLEHGSPASALSLAILAFEEAGKGQREELGLQKTKRTPSWHQFRQIVAAFNLQASFFQKYEIELGEIPEQMQQELRARWADAKTTSEAAKRPIPDEIRKSVGEALAPAFNHLTADEFEIAQIEMRWVRRVLESAAKGNIEELRQRSIYVDITNGAVTSEPTAVGVQEAFRWLFAAKRVLLLLEHGDYMAPYSPLAARLESRVGVRPKSSDLRDFFDGYVKKIQSGQHPIDAYFSTLPKDEQDEFRSLLPALKSILDRQPQ